MKARTHDFSGGRTPVIYTNVIYTNVAIINGVLIVFKDFFIVIECRGRCSNEAKSLAADYETLSGCPNRESKQGLCMGSILGWGQSDNFS